MNSVCNLLIACSPNDCETKLKPSSIFTSAKTSKSETNLACALIDPSIVTDTQISDVVIASIETSCSLKTLKILYKNPWYVKFMIEDGLLEQISFHPPKKQIKTITGLVIPKGF